MAFKTTFKSLLVLIIFSFLSFGAFAQAFKSITEAKGLAIGSKVTKFTTVDQFNKTYHLSDALKKGPVVLMFYRGHWCPVCSRHLSQLQDSLQLIYKKGATVVAVSPEKPENLGKTASKVKASFTLLYDKDYSIAQAFDVLFKPKSPEVPLNSGKLTANLESPHSEASPPLPVPATFIINRKGIVVWRHYNPDYRVRASVQEIIKNIPSR